MQICFDYITIEKNGAVQESRNEHFFQENFDIENILWIVGCKNNNLVEISTVGHHIVHII